MSNVLICVILCFFCCSSAGLNLKIFQHIDEMMDVVLCLVSDDCLVSGSPPPVLHAEPGGLVCSISSVPAIQIQELLSPYETHSSWCQGAAEEICESQRRLPAHLYLRKFRLIFQ